MLNRFKQSEQPWSNPQSNNILSKSPQKHHYENYHQNYQNEKDYHSASNMMMNMKKSKPLISPKKMTQQENNQFIMNRNRHSQQMLGRQKLGQNNFIAERNQNVPNCMNHPSKKAQFTTMMDESNQFEYYCGRCAAQLATRGIQVQKIEMNRNLNSTRGMMKSKKQYDLPHYPQYANEPIYQQILQILSMSNQVVKQHHENIQKFSSLEKQYEQQMDFTANFYDRLIQIIEEMKNDHLQDLNEEKQKYTQIADIQNDNLRQNIQEINVIKNDIEDHLEEVIQGIRQTGDTAECKESLEHYRQKLTICRHLTEEQQDTLKQVTCYPQNQFDTMVENFENFLKTLWDEPQNNTQALDLQCQENSSRPNFTKNFNSAMTVKNIHQILPKGVNYENCEGKKAFRNLQDDQEQEVADRKSPIFKQI